jgi:hypothetical protein
VKKLATYALIVLLIWWAAKDPAAAAHFVRSVGGLFTHAAGSLSTVTGSGD